jgi:hypothetical protein
MIPLLFMMFRHPYHRDLMHQAKGLLHEGKHPLAVVVAQTACEVLTEQMMTALTERLDEPLRKWVRGRRRPRNADLYDKRVRTLYTALSGDHIESQPFWPDYKKHVELRHQVVHRGVHVDEADARRSCDAAQKLLEHVEAVQARLLVDPDTTTPPPSGRVA